MLTMLCSLFKIQPARSYRSVAKEFGLCHVMRFMRQKARFVASGDPTDRPQIGYTKLRRVISADMEDRLSEYVRNASRLLWRDTMRLS